MNIMKINFKRIRNSVAVLMIVSLTACEEVIDLDLNSSNPVLVAEGVMDNELAAWVKLSYTSDYFDAEPAIVEKNATVVVSDNEGNSETLEYISDGLYQGKDLLGSLDKQYTMTISTDEVEYDATSKLFPPSEIIDISFEENSIKKPEEDESTYDITITFKDDIAVNNYYLIKYQSSGEVEEDASTYYLVDDDYYENTGVIEYAPFRLSFELGDEVNIELYSVDEDTYIYYSQLNDEGGGMRGSSTPYTPKSNFGSDVLGYFVAWSMVEQTAIVE